MRNSRSAEDIRTLAEWFRQMAETTNLPEYGQLMAKAATDLEHRAAVLESPERVVLLPVAVAPRAQSLTGRFDATITVLSAR